MIDNAYSWTIGKTVAGVIVKQGGRPPGQQMFILFTDGTSFEIWGELSCSEWLDSWDAERVRSYMAPEMRVVAEAWEPGKIVVPGKE